MLLRPFKGELGGNVVEKSEIGDSRALRSEKCSQNCATFLTREPSYRGAKNIFPFFGVGRWRRDLQACIFPQKSNEMEGPWRRGGDSTICPKGMLQRFLRCQISKKRNVRNFNSLDVKYLNTERTLSITLLSLPMTPSYTYVV